MTYLQPSETSSKVLKPQEETSELFFLENAAIEVLPCSLVEEALENQLIDLERCFPGIPAVSTEVPGLGGGERRGLEHVVAGCAVSAPLPPRPPKPMSNHCKVRSE